MQGTTIYHIHAASHNTFSESISLSNLNFPLCQFLCGLTVNSQFLISLCQQMKVKIEKQLTLEFEQNSCKPLSKYMDHWKNKIVKITWLLQLQGFKVAYMLLMP